MFEWFLNTPLNSKDFKELFLKSLTAEKFKILDFFIEALISL